jgi:protocadherin delta 1
VTVVDVNDNKPSIAVNILTESGAAEVRENIDQAGTFVAHVAARDADSGNNGKVECQLDDGVGSETPLFRLEPLFDEATLAIG